MGGFRSLFKVRKPGHGSAFEAKVKDAGKKAIPAPDKTRGYSKTSVKI